MAKINVPTQVAAKRRKYNFVQDLVIELVRNSVVVFVRSVLSVGYSINYQRPVRLRRRT